MGRAGPSMDDPGARERGSVPIGDWPDYALGERLFMTVEDFASAPAGEVVLFERALYARLVRPGGYPEGGPADAAFAPFRAAWERVRAPLALVETETGEREAHLVEIDVRPLEGPAERLWVAPDGGPDNLAIFVTQTDQPGVDNSGHFIDWKVLLERAPTLARVA